MSKRARNPDVPEISEATRLAFKAEAAEKLQAKAEHKEKRLGWGARLEAAAQAGSGVELEPVATEQKQPKQKKSKHKKKHKSHKKRRHHSSSDSDDSSQEAKRRKVKKQQAKGRKQKLEDSSTSNSEPSVEAYDSKSDGSHGRHRSKSTLP